MNWDDVKWIDDETSPTGVRAVYTDSNSGDVSYVNPNRDTGAPEIASTIASGAAFQNPYISALSNSGLSASDAQNLYNESQSNPHQFYTDVASQLSNAYLQGWAYNQANSDIYNTLQSIKSVDPQAYYPAQIQTQSNMAGWEQAQGRPDLAANPLSDLQKAATEAQQNGINADQVNSLAQTGYSYGLKGSQSEMANAASGSGGFLDGLPQFAAAVTAAGLGLGAGFGALGLLGEGLEAAPLTTDILSSTGFTPAAGASFAIDPAASYVAATPAFADIAAPAANISAPAVDGFGLNAGPSTVGANSPSGIMATQSASGLGGSGTGVIEGLSPTSVGMGGTTGAGSLAGIAGTEAAAGLGGAALGTGLSAEQLAQYEAASPNSVSTSDVLNNAKRLQNIAKLLNGSNSSNSIGSSIPTAQQWNAQALQNLSQATPQQFGGLYEMNKNPFTFTNPMANALAGNKQTGIYDVSGNPGTGLNTSQQNKIYSSLLRS
jgi:hypothetical protein